LPPASPGLEKYPKELVQILQMGQQTANDLERRRIAFIEAAAT
jgi:hypothetical protein